MPGYHKKPKNVNAEQFNGTQNSNQWPEGVHQHEETGTWLFDRGGGEDVRIKHLDWVVRDESTAWIVSPEDFEAEYEED